MTANPKKTKPAYAGLSITRHSAELAVFSPKSMAIEHAASIPIPSGVFDQDGDVIHDFPLLKEIIQQLFKSIGTRLNAVHLSVPGTLMRLVEMPKMEAAGLYVSLSSEAERYKTFDNTEAIVDFAQIPSPHVASNQQQVVFGAVRSDTLGGYLKLLKDLKIKPASIILEPLATLRAMAGTGVLDGLVQQIGTDAHWGMIFVEPTRVRLSIWQCDRLIELRETTMETQEFAVATTDSIAVEDLLEEIRRTTKAVQPSVWLSHELPASMQQAVGERLGIPIYPAPLGQGLVMNQPLQLPTIGAALSSVVQFPFDFDITGGITRSGGVSAPKSASSQPSAMDEMASSGSSPLIPLGIGSLVLGGIVSAALFVAAMVVGQQIPGLEQRRDGSKLEVSGLESRKQELQKQVELDKALLEMIENSKIRNHVYVALTQDLKQKTPEKIWLGAIQITNDMELNGKALNHQSVINFARGFDEALYGKNIKIKSIKEGKLGAAQVYDFTIAGGINLDKTFLEDTPLSTKNANAPTPGDAPKGEPQ